MNIIPLFLFLLAFLYNKKKVGRFFCLSNYILLLYVFSTFSFWLYSLIEAKVYYNLLGLLLIFVPTVVLILPLSMLERRMMGERCELSVLPYQRFRVFSMVLIALSGVSIVFFGANIANVFSVNIVDLRSGFGAFYEGGTLLSKVACLGAYMFPVALFLFYYNLCKRVLPVSFTWLLLAGSFSFVFYTLNVAGRDGIVVWLLTFGALYFFFKMFFVRDESKIIKRILVAGLVVFVPVFVFISSSRFAGSEGGTFVSVVSYAGQSLYYLSKHLDVYLTTGVGAIGDVSTFELVYRVSDFFTGDVLTATSRHMDYADYLFYYNLGYTTNAFSFYVGSLFPINLSFFGFVAFLVVMFLVYQRYLRMEQGVVSTRHLICAFCWYMIIIVGIFYFYYGTFIGNFFLLISLFIPFVL